EAICAYANCHQWRAPWTFEKDLVTDRKPLAAVNRYFQFIHGRNRIVLQGDVALAGSIGDKVVLPQAKLGRALARFEESRGREIGPVRVALPKVLEHLIMR